jgi:hypothetical protein
MTFYNTFARRQNLGILATGLGVAGAVFFWWAPVGIILSVAGLIVGLIAWVRVEREASNHLWVFAGILLSIAALVLDVIIALNNAELVQYRSFY